MKRLKSRKNGSVWKFHCIFRNSRSTQIFRFWFNKVSSLQRRGSTVVPTDFYHSYTTALSTCYSYTYTNASGFELFINFILIFTLYYLLKRQAHMNTRWSVLPGRDRSVSSPGLKLN